MGSIPTARAVNKNTEQSSVFLFTRAKRDRDRTSDERVLSEVGRPSEKGSDDKSEQVRAFSGRSGQVSPPLTGGGRGRNSYRPCTKQVERAKALFRVVKTRVL